MVNDITEKSDLLKKLTKDTIGLGIVSSVGLTAVGAFGANPSVTKPVGTALNLANIGNVANIGLNLGKVIKK